MKAPDKIYLEKSLSNPDRLHSQWYPNDVIGGGIEYIRKDALIEWASNMLGQVSDMGFDDGDVEHGYTRALEDIIDKINSL